MKLYITTNTDLDLSELARFNIEATVRNTKLTLPSVDNPYFNEKWGDFNFVRMMAPSTGYDGRCYMTTKDSLKSSGITSHIGMYDLVDKDGIMDFYAGVPSRLNTKAKANGFKTNEAWLIVHELCHGLCQKAGIHDSTHAMQEQGRLIELWEELYNLLLKKKISMLQQIVSLLRQLKNPTPGLQPLVKRNADAVSEHMAMLGYPIRITEGYRTPERQDELYAQGRTRPGNIVTNARAGESFHNYGVAVDIVFRKEGYTVSDKVWKTFGALANTYGFEWGGDWEEFVDFPHIQMTLGYTIEDFKNGNVNYNRYK